MIRRSRISRFYLHATKQPEAAVAVLHNDTDVSIAARTLIRTSCTSNSVTSSIDAPGFVDRGPWETIELFLKTVTLV